MVRALRRPRPSGAAPPAIRTGTVPIGGAGETRVRSAPQVTLPRPRPEDRAGSRRPPKFYDAVVASEETETFTVGTAVASTGKPVLAVGYPLGFTAPLDGSEVPELPYAIRLGDATLDLAEEHWQLWLSAFDGGEKANLVAATARLGVERRSVDDLFAAGALIELEDVPAANADLFERLRILPTGIGLGNSADERARFRIALPGIGVRITTDVRAYHVWRRCDGRVTLAQACRDEAVDAGVAPEVVVAQIAVNLSWFLREGVIYLDAA